MENIKEMKDNTDIIEALNVDYSWKERFKLIDKWYENGILFKNEKQKVLSPEERRSVYFSVIFKNKGFITFILAALFGPLYYLFKGLWVKAIVYTFFLFLLFFVLIIIFPDFKSSGMSGAIACIYGTLAPFDYYRLKVLKKHW